MDIQNESFDFIKRVEPSIFTFSNALDIDLMDNFNPNLPARSIKFIDVEMLELHP